MEGGAIKKRQKNALIVTQVFLEDTIKAYFAIIIDCSRLQF